MGWIRRFRSTLLGSRVSSEFEEEARFHLDQRIAEYVNGGMSPEDAAREAKRRLGSLTLAREQTREVDTLRWLDDLGREFRFAGRQLLRTPGFTIVAVLTLGLAIGACTIIYSVVYGIALRPLPYSRPDAIVELRQVNGSGQRDPFSDPNFDDLKAQASSFEAMAEYSPGTISVIAGSLPLRAGTSTVSHNFFDVMSTYPARGRRFIDEELHENGPRAAIVSARFWKEHFGTLQDLSTARLRLGGDPYAVVGVMPAGFDFPSGIDILTPREGRARNPFRNGQNWQVVARMRPGVPLATARAEGTAIARRLKEQYGKTTSMVDVAIVPLQETLVGSVRPLLFVLLTSVVFLLIVACANLASMLLARTSARRREMAVRSALGATGSSLVLPLVAESLIVAALGGTVALLLADAGIRAVSVIDLGGLPRTAEIRLDWEGSPSRPGSRGSRPSCSASSPDGGRSDLTLRRV